jgi:hypothetical protein
MKKYNIILIIFFTLFFYKNSIAADNLKGINSLFIGSEDVAGAKNNCNLSKDKILRSVKYLISEAKIPTTDSFVSNEVLYIQPIVVKVKNICAGMITFQTFSIAEVANSGGNIDYMQVLSYNETQLVTEEPGKFSDFYLETLEEMTTEFINEWKKVN